LGAFSSVPPAPATPSRLPIRPRPSKNTPGHPSTLAAHTGQGQLDARWAAYSDTMREGSPSISAATTARPQMVPSVKAFQGRQRGYDAFYPSPSTFASLILYFTIFLTWHTHCGPFAIYTRYRACIVL
jgi:hypothetical protein